MKYFNYSEVNAIIVCKFIFQDMKGWNAIFAKMQVWLNHHADVLTAGKCSEICPKHNLFCQYATVISFQLKKNNLICVTSI